MDLLDRLLRHDAWTTGELLRCCRGLSDEPLDREFDLGHRTVRATLVHIVFNLEVWALLLAGRPVRAALASRSRGQSIAELSARLELAAADLSTVARAVARRDGWDATFVDTLDEPPTDKTYGGGIAHVLTHGMHHRAQAIHMLRRLGVKGVPEGDVLTWERQAGAADVLLRDVVETDLPVFFEQQRDRTAVWMAAFTVKDPEDGAAFAAHWKKVLGDATILAKTIVVEGRAAGHVLKFQHDGKPEVTYWLAKEHWGKGITTKALSEFLRHVPDRPLFARAAKDNRGSIRVLEKCGFSIRGAGKWFANARGAEIEEVILELGAG